MTCRAKLSFGVPLGMLFMAGILTLDAWLVDRLLAQEVRFQHINFLSFLIAIVVIGSLPLLVLLLYQTVSCLTLRYRLDRNSITVRWGGYTQIVPIRDVQRILPGRELPSTVVRRRGIRWPGHERGEGAVPGLGRTRFLATRPLAQQLLLVTPGLAIAISPRDEAGFLKAFDRRRALGPNRLLPPELRRAPWLTWSFWADHTAWILLGAALLINLGLFGFIAARFPALDLQLPLHFDRLGLPDRIGTKAELFTLPIIGFIILGTNLVLGLLLYRRERAGAYLLWGAAAVAQTLFWLATISLLP